MHPKFTIALIFSCQLVAVRSQLTMSMCPSDMIESREGICFFAIQRPLKYCEAHSACWDEGHKRNRIYFVVGQNAKLFSKFNQQVSSFVTSVNKLLGSGNESSLPWRVGDPGQGNYTSMVKSMTGLNSVDKNTLFEGVSIIRNGNWSSQRQIQISHHVVCQLVHNPFTNKLIQVERFQSNWPWHLSRLIHSDSVNKGCFTTLSTNTLIECSLRCHLNLQCRSSYYNRSTKSCMLSLFVDSLLPPSANNQKGTWVRLGRPFF